VFGLVRDPPFKEGKKQGNMHGSKGRKTDTTLGRICESDFFLGQNEEDAGDVVQEAETDKGKKLKDRNKSRFFFLSK
jgi:hypothetical protein